MNGDRAPLTDVGTVVDDLKASIVFLTRLPPRMIGVDAQVRPDFARGARVFPIAGALIGVIGGLVLIAAALIGAPPLVSATLAVAATIALTGGLHEDGLADTADSLGGATVEQRLEIMDDSRLGTYGAAALIVAIVIRVGALATIAGDSATAAALALIATEAVSRAALVWIWQELPAARMGGLAQETGPPDQNAMLVALAAALVIAVVTGVPAVGLRATVLGSVLAAIAAYSFTRITARSIGGRTGDSLGACQQVAAVAFLVGAATS